MEYRSTRGVTGRAFADVLIEGLAPDGGLYVPASLPALPQLPPEFAAAVAAFVTGFIEPDPLADGIGATTSEVYTRFTHPEVAPLRDMGNDRHLLELFWGPTLSFKDYALQLVGALFDQVLARTGERILVLGATSGDTGSAAIEACRGRPRMDVVILYPDGAISDVQRRQMTTVPDANVHAVAVRGTFDDCQSLVKQGFNAWRDRYPLAAINSINWARIMAQAAYYAFTAARFSTPIRFVVPTGNFGNVLSGHLARRMGASIGRLTVANNVNHGLTDLITTGTLEIGTVAPSLAPAMDIQIPSNLERYLFEIIGADPEAIRAIQARLAQHGRIELPGRLRDRISADFDAAWRPDADIAATIGRTYAETGVVLDPHTAVAWSVATETPADMPTVVVATAHPAKFGTAVGRATGQVPTLPPAVAAQLAGDERLNRVEPDLDSLRSLLDRLVG